MSGFGPAALESEASPQQIASSRDIRWVMSNVCHADHKMTYAVSAQLQRNLPPRWRSDPAAPYCARNAATALWVC
jgi:hypothetical protein